MEWILSGNATEISSKENLYLRVPWQRCAPPPTRWIGRLLLLSLERPCRFQRDLLDVFQNVSICHFIGWGGVECTAECCKPFSHSFAHVDMQHRFQLRRKDCSVHRMDFFIAALGKPCSCERGIYRNQRVSASC